MGRAGGRNVDHALGDVASHAPGGLPDATWTGGASGQRVARKRGRTHVHHHASDHHYRAGHRRRGRRLHQVRDAATRRGRAHFLVDLDQDVRGVVGRASFSFLLIETAPDCAEKVKKRRPSISRNSNSDDSSSRFFERISFVYGYFTLPNLFSKKAVFHWPISIPTNEPLPKRNCDDGWMGTIIPAHTQHTTCPPLPSPLPSSRPSCPLPAPAACPPGAAP